MTALRRGEAPILVRYEGAYAATTLTVMGDRTGFAWTDPPRPNRIDELVAAKWRRMKIQPSELCTDAEFLRRVSLDLTGLPPTSDEVRAFAADPTESAAKRDALIARLIGRPEFVDYWTNKWADLLQVNRKFLGVEGAVGFRDWIRSRSPRTSRTTSSSGAPDRQGSNRANPAASYYKILREPTAIMENTTQLFLAVRYNCNKCHDHPFERWTQDQYYELSAFFARVGLKADPASKGRNLGGSAVEAAVPLFEEVYDKPDGEVTHDRTKQVAPARVPVRLRPGRPRRPRRPPRSPGRLDHARDNPYFARSHVNRLWGYLFGVGIIEPIDDIRAGNPASNPDLLDYLTREFIDSGFDTRHILRADLPVADLPALGRPEPLERRRQDQLLARDRPPLARRGLARLGLPRDRLRLQVPRRRPRDPGRGAARFRGRAAQRVPLDLRPPGPRERLRVRAVLRPPARPGDGAGQRPDARRRHRRPRQRRHPARGPRARRPEARRGAVPPDPEPAGDPGRGADLPGRPPGDRRATGPASPAPPPTAPSRSPQALPRLEQARLAAIAAAQAALDAHERANAPRYAAEEQARLDTIAQLEADLKAYEAAEPERIAAWEQTQSPLNRWRTLTPAAVTDTEQGDLRGQPRRLGPGLGERRRGRAHGRRRDRPAADHRAPARSAPRPEPAQPGAGPGARRQLRPQRADGDRRPEGRPEAGQAGRARQPPGRLQPGRVRDQERRRRRPEPDQGLGGRRRVRPGPLGHLRPRRARRASPRGPSSPSP